MDLSIIIVNYKCRDLVKVCINNLKAALASNKNNDLRYEIIVVDNDSNDGIKDMLFKNFPEVKFIQLAENKGYGGGNNAGIKTARGKYVLILNPDVMVLEGAIEKMRAFMEAHPEIGILGPQLLNPDGTIQPSCMRFYKFFTPVCRRLAFLQYLSFVKKELARFEMGDFDHKKNQEIEDWIFGPCLMVRKKAIDEAGCFDERFLLFFEDTDLCRRFKLAGWKIYYLADAKVIHMDERLSQKSKGLKALRHKTTWIHISSWIKYFWKWRAQENKKTRKQ
ncbi:MAG: glycosyltransferase family 2 protein [bacterium]